ncbi:MAG: hypothetical protein E7231_15370 [Cellulosilyticum sp.]|nr:hypothetical protein [Cellulosilyticum sp.]
MPKTLLLNASPRENGTSHMLCMRLKTSLHGTYRSLYGKTNTPQSLLQSIQEADTIVLIGSCYCNSYPGNVTELFEYLADYKDQLTDKVWYGIIHGGMPYTHTHESGLKHLEYFCKCCDMSYKGGFIITMAPMLNGKPLEKHLFSKTIVPAFEKFTEAIKTQAVSPDSLYQSLEPKMPFIITKAFSLFLSHSVDQSLKKYGLNPKDKSPYLKD